jgi:hypothetical protein
MARKLDGDEILQRWKDGNNAHNFEGESGMKRFEKLCEALGYQETGFRFGTPIERFLSDNSGAIDAILDFLTDQLEYNQEWRDALAGWCEKHGASHPVDEECPDEDDESK